VRESVQALAKGTLDIVAKSIKRDFIVASSFPASVLVSVSYPYFDGLQGVGLRSLPLAPPVRLLSFNDVDIYISNSVYALRVSDDAAPLLRVPAKQRKKRWWAYRRK
jgi:hypothetical protein